jgi:tRNA A-37 threonylcarbamoyl transferase component Bud32
MSVDEAPALVAGRYRLGEVVGAGGMGTVWRAVDEVLGREVAVKRVRLAGLPPADAALARERTMREARIAAALHHPNIVSIFDVVLEDDEPWLVLEYLPSRGLGEILGEHGSPPPTAVAAIGAQVAAALAAAHDAGVVHRDVKPDNILVADRATPGSAGPLVKLTDFGISHAATAPVLTATEVLTGTPAYFAPETARGEGTDSRTDVYSLGASLYAAVEGHPPFGTDTGNILALLARIGRGQVPPPRNAGHLTGIIRKLTADDPARRPTAAQAHRTLLQAASTAPAREATDVVLAGGRVVGRSRRRFRVVTAATTVLAVVAAGIIALVIDNGRTSSAGTRPSEPVVVAGAGAPQVYIDDPQTADPCALVDTTALSAYGSARIDRDDAPFAVCRVHIVRPGGLLSFRLRIRGPAELTEPIAAARETLDGRDVYRPAITNGECWRRIVLSPLNAVDLYVSVLDGEPANDLCDIAETGARTTVTALADGVIGTRTRVDQTTALGGTSACSLLQAADLAALPGLRNSTPGVGDWDCTWDDGGPTSTMMVLIFYLGDPLEEIAGTRTDIAGRPGVVTTFDDGCDVQFVQRHYIGENWTPRVEKVWLTLTGPRRGADPCGTATALATAAARKLPPPT